MERELRPREKDGEDKGCGPLRDERVSVLGRGGREYTHTHTHRAHLCAAPT